MIFSFGPNAPFSASLLSEAFLMPLAEAEADFATLLEAGAQPFSISEDGEVLSQGIGIPFSVEGRWLLYLYALATAPAARGRGLLRTLLGEVAEGAERAGYSALTLLPASASLAEAYGRMGFTERYTAGGAPSIKAGGDLSLRIAGEPPTQPASGGTALYRALGRHLSPALFAFTLSTLRDRIAPFSIGEGYALLHRDDRTCALSVSEGVAAREEDRGFAFLLYPLRGRTPRRLPEPMPR